MNGIVAVAVRLVEAGKRIYARKTQFLGVFAVVFFGSVVALGQMDLLPDAPRATTPPAVVLTANVLSAADLTSSPQALTPVRSAEEPVKIAIPAIRLAATISNPTTTNLTVLDTGLLSGAVRYPTSALLGESGNVVLFGHSSYLPIVGNQAYKTFDGIQKLVVGDTIAVSSTDTAYTYRVTSVVKESAASDTGIPLAVGGRELTLVTCNSFATKSDRFVVTAEFVESHSVSNS